MLGYIRRNSDRLLGVAGVLIAGLPNLIFSDDHRTDAQQYWGVGIYALGGAFVFYANRAAVRRVLTWLRR